MTTTCEKLADEWLESRAFIQSAVRVALSESLAAIVVALVGTPEDLVARLTQHVDTSRFDDPCNEFFATHTADMRRCVYCRRTGLAAAFPICDDCGGICLCNRAGCSVGNLNDDL